jgi:O-methyltransferase
VVKSGVKDSMYRDGEHANTGKMWVEKLVQNEFNLPNVHILAGVFPDETGAGLSEQEFRFCHIDVDVYQSAIDILEWVWPRLVPGGVVVYDDYGFPYCDGITRHVDEQIGRSDALIVHNLNGHALMIKRD